MKKDEVLRYSMWLSFLIQLLRLGLITEREYSLIKNRIMNEFNIVSDLDG